MSLESISIHGWLEVLPGGVINLPGCEPVSALTSTTLDVNRKCNASIITLERAKELIPDAKVFMTHNPIKWYFVLPNGPPSAPGCPCVSQEDWYQILRDGAEPVPGNEQDDTSSAEGCNPFAIGLFGGQ
jgi:hypothetical protein